jgi:TRAP-type C4-dicarboxylate transport system permease small subunit
MRGLSRGLEVLSEAGGWLAGAVVLALTAMIVAAVLARRVLGAPILAADEISGYLLLAIVFLGLAYTMKTGGHIRTDLLLAHVPGRVRRVLELGATALGLVFTAALLAGNGVLVAEYWSRGTLSFRYLQLPLWMPATLLVAGALLLLLQLLAQLLRQLGAGGRRAG